jgi:hypothetical protein
LGGLDDGDAVLNHRNSANTYFSNITELTCDNRREINKIFGNNNFCKGKRRALMWKMSEVIYSS